MKNELICLIAFVFVLSACENQLAEPLSEVNSLVSQINHRGGNDAWEETFEYDNQHRLISATDLRSLGRRRNLEYQEGQLFQERTYELMNETLAFRDSIVRDDQGQIEAIYKFSVNGGEDVPLSRIEHLFYDDQGQVIESRTEYLNSGDYRPRKVFHWENGNIIKEDQYWNGTDLSIEFYFTYDDKLGINSNSILLFHQAGQPTRNNVISVDWTDHSGLYDTACKPCTTSYGYDDRQRPTSFSTNWGYSATIVYKELNIQEE